MISSKEKQKIKGEYYKIKNKILNFEETEDYKRKESFAKKKTFINLILWFLLFSKIKEIYFDDVPDIYMCILLILGFSALSYHVFCLCVWESNQINQIREKYSVSSKLNYDIYKGFIFVKEKDYDKDEKYWEIKENLINCSLFSYSDCLNRKVCLNPEDVDFLIIQGNRYMVFENAGVL